MSSENAFHMYLLDHKILSLVKEFTVAEKKGFIFDRVKNMQRIEVPNSFSFFQNIFRAFPFVFMRKMFNELKERALNFIELLGNAVNELETDLGWLSTKRESLVYFHSSIKASRTAFVLTCLQYQA